MKTRLRPVACGLVLVALGTSHGNAQSLANRINAVREGRVHFTFAAREGVCGNGRSFISIGSDMHIGSYSFMSDGRLSEPCQRGPVRVVLDRADGAVIDVNTYVGTATGEPAVTDAATNLGAVRAADAAQYFLGLAATADGKPSRDAILPAVLADSIDVTQYLLALARDEARPRETRRSAMSWAGRLTDTPGAGPRVAEALVRIARNENDNNNVREQALNTLARLDHGAGIGSLMELARTGGDAWLVRGSVQALAQSGDPRARGYLRSLVERADAPDDVMAIAIRGVGREFATARDAELLRQVYPKLSGERTKQSVINTLGEVGGTANERWLLGIARDENERQSLRRHALQQARRNVPIAELVALYDRTTDPSMKEALISIYVESGDRAAIDKLISILRSEENQRLRRRAINHLSRSEDPRVRAELAKIVDQ